MKIVKEPVFPEQTCNICRAVVKITQKDLKYNGWTMAKSDWKCPICKSSNRLHIKLDTDNQS